MIYVGIDLHRKRSQIAALDEQGTELLSCRVANDAEALKVILAELGTESPPALIGNSQQDGSEKPRKQQRHRLRRSVEQLSGLGYRLDSDRYSDEQQAEQLARDLRLRLLGDARVDRARDLRVRVAREHGRFRERDARVERPATSALDDHVAGEGGGPPHADTVKIAFLAAMIGAASLLARRTAAFPRWLATGGLWFAPLLALSGTAFPLNNSAIYATLELTLIGLLTWVIASTVAIARRSRRDTAETVRLATV